MQWEQESKNINCAGCKADAAIKKVKAILGTEVVIHIMVIEQLVPGKEKLVLDVDTLGVKGFESEDYGRGSVIC